MMDYTADDLDNLIAQCAERDAAKSTNSDESKALLKYADECRARTEGGTVRRKVKK